MEFKARHYWPGILFGGPGGGRIPCASFPQRALMRMRNSYVENAISCMGHTLAFGGLQRSLNVDKKDGSPS